MYNALIAVSLCIMAVGLPCYCVAIKPGYTYKTLIIKLLCSTAFLLTAIFAALKTGTINEIFPKFMIIGFALSWVGDALLHLDPPIPQIAVGVVAFLGAHICFIYAYVKTLGGAFITSKEIIAIAIMWVIVIAAALFLKLKLNLYALVIVVYGTVLMFMMVKAFELGLSFADRTVLPVILLTGGALLFAVSDAALAAGFFGKKTYGNKLLNIITYFIGQTLLALSILAVAK